MKHRLQLIVNVARDWLFAGGVQQPDAAPREDAPLGKEASEEVRVLMAAAVKGPLLPSQQQQVTPGISYSTCDLGVQSGCM